MAGSVQEPIARAIYEGRNGKGCKPWAHLPDAHKKPYLDDATNAMEADGMWGDAVTLRGFIREHHMTPSMVASLMMHWQRRALEAEDAIRWARPRLSKEAYREQLDKKVSLGPAPDLDEPRLVQSVD
jgi:hypothetical protein